MTNRSISTICYFGAFILTLIALWAFVLDTRFRDCVRDAYFNPNTILASDEEIQEGCARTMWPVSFFFR